MRRTSFAAVALLASSLVAAPAAAESGEFNLHIDLGAGFPVLGANGPDRLDGILQVGPVGAVSFDWQVFAPLAFEVIVGGGYMIGDNLYAAGADGGSPYFNAGAGVRVRILDNQEGYLANGGDWIGNFWASAHLGFHYYDGPQFGIDVAVGYEASIIEPLQLGVFARGALLVEGDNSGFDAIITLGVNASFELGGEVDALDRDGDGLPDEREINQYETDAGDPDTDHDGLEDGIEVHHTTNPLVADTDGDGALDGTEDANHDGNPDPDEADPRIPDTDQGGVPDGYELTHGMNARDPADDDGDRDGVLTNVDQCPDTAQGAEVDERGCVLIRERLVLRGIQFAYDSADILPESEGTLQIAIQALRDNPDVRVEVGGHTDNQGSRQYNRDLSQRRAAAVREYLINHGVDGSRMTARGYGLSRPTASNDTEEGRAENRRIEFTVID
ncbi:MAG: OmpA family protein [Sandaracinaceae bacterium]